MLPGPSDLACSSSQRFFLAFASSTFCGGPPLHSSRSHSFSSSLRSKLLQAKYINLIRFLLPSPKCDKKVTANASLACPQVLLSMPIQRPTKCWISGWLWHFFFETSSAQFTQSRAKSYHWYGISISNTAKFCFINITKLSPICPLHFSVQHLRKLVCSIKLEATHSVSRQTGIYLLFHLEHHWAPCLLMPQTLNFRLSSVWVFSLCFSPSLIRLITMDGRYFCYNNKLVCNNFNEWMQSFLHICSTCRGTSKVCLSSLSAQAMCTGVEPSWFQKLFHRSNTTLVNLSDLHHSRFQNTTLIFNSVQFYL